MKKREKSFLHNNSFLDLGLFLMGWCCSSYTRSSHR